ncbi:MAG TPA: DUF3231 family protein [Symbiobacteriaceae bacterium]|nr:DUF3231 family protein [Symbiobacteriaceae bacterium]
MNILESLFQTTDQPTAAPHLGEAYGLWLYYTLLDDALSFCQLTSNHAHDADLRKLIAEVANDLERPQRHKVEELMAREGIPFPEVTMPKHPTVDPDSIPQAARMADVEIANIQALKLQALITTSTANMQQALRDDIGGVYMAFKQELIAMSLRLKKLMQQRGWLIVPPAFGRQAPNQ